MIRLPKFNVVAPHSLEESLKILSQSNGETKILAGGTDLIVGLKEGTSKAKNIVWLGKVEELQQITFSREGGLKVGAICTLDELERHGDVQKYFPSLIAAIRTIASPQIRNRATIGGNLCLNTRCFYYDQSEFWRNALGYCLKSGDGICHAAPELSTCSAVFCSDLAPLLIALNATIEVRSSKSQRKIPLAELYANDGMRHLTLSPHEVLCSISIPYDQSVRSVQKKFRLRESIDFSLVNVGVALSFSEKKECRTAAIVVGAVSSAPIVATEAVKKLVGQELTESIIQKVAEEAAKLVRPIPTVDVGVSYRKKIVGVLVRRALRELIHAM